MEPPQAIGKALASILWPLPLLVILLLEKELWAFASIRMPLI